MGRMLRGLVLLAGLVPVVACGAAQPPAFRTWAPPAPPITSASPVPSRPAPEPAPEPAPSPAAPEPLLPPRPDGPAGAGAGTVLLDPGHNGANGAHPADIDRQVPNGRGGTKPCNTTGAATDAGYPEAAFTWDVALRVADGLRARGVRVVLSRPDNAGVGPCVDQRAATASREGADAMVSVHADGAAASGHGFHVAYSDPPLNPSQGAPSVALARALAGSLRDAGFTNSDYIGSGGLNPRSDLAGLNLARVPAALVECANMRNAREAALISTPAGRARYASAITEGVAAWLASRGLLPPS